MKARAHVLILTAIVSVVPLISAVHRPWPRQQIRGVRRLRENYARKHSRGPSAAASRSGPSAARSSVAFWADRPAPLVGAAIGGGTGGAAGGVKRVTNYNTLYTQAYTGCMSA